MTMSFTFWDPGHPVWVEVQAGWQRINSCYKEKILLDGLLCPQAVWSLDQLHHWPFFAHSGHPLHSQTLIYDLQLVYLCLVDLLVQQLKKERVVQTNFSLTENPISHCLTVFCSNLVSVQINPNRTEILALIPKLRALTVTNDNRNYLQSLHANWF